MIQIKTDKLHAITPEHGLSKEELTTFEEQLSGAIKGVQSRDQGFYSVIDDKTIVEKIEEFCNERKDQYDHYVLLGIGGSSLGTICIQQSLGHLYKNPKLIVLDNIDPIMFKEVEDVITLPKTLFIVVTKSGGTPETISEYLYFRNRCDEANLKAADHFVFITDPEKGFLRSRAIEEQIPSFEVPTNVGGRFSVLTAVGLLPAKLMNFDIRAMLKGAQSMRDKFLSEDPAQNLPFQLAAIQFLLSEKGKNINVMIPYAQKLIRFADWYRQLLAESIGKKVNLAGEEIHTGITPVNALGATDQHSQSQLYNEGPNDKLHMFIKVNHLGEELPIPDLYDDPSLEYLKNVSFNKLLNTELEGTAQAFTQNDRPNITVEIDAINEHTLGELFLLFEGATAFLGEMFNIDAFNQPGVELSKLITKQLLSQT